MAAVVPTLLAPVDFSPSSLRALREAARLAQRMAGSITILHVRPVSDVAAAIAEGREDLIKGNSRALAAALKRHYADRLAALAVRSGAVEARLATGRASREILKAARGFDLVVMGRTGKGRVAGLLGGTTGKVLASSPVPVVVVPA